MKTQASSSGGRPLPLAGGTGSKRREAEGLFEQPQTEALPQSSPTEKRPLENEIGCEFALS